MAEPPTHGWPLKKLFFQDPAALIRGIFLKQDQIHWDEFYSQILTLESGLDSQGA